MWQPQLVVVMDGRIAQSVERWSNKPLVMGSSPIVTIVFFLICKGHSHERIRGRAVKALRSGRSQLCWRGFESHRMQLFFSLFWRRLSRVKKMAVPGFEPGSSGSQPLMLTTTLYHHIRVWIFCQATFCIAKPHPSPPFPCQPRPFSRAPFISCWHQIDGQSDCPTSIKNKTKKRWRSRVSIPVPHAC